jgi:hypothetical protein
MKAAIAINATAAATTIDFFIATFLSKWFLAAKAALGHHPATFLFCALSRPYGATTFTM